MNPKVYSAFSLAIKAIMPLIVFLGVLIIGYILRKIIFNRLNHWASKTKSSLDDIIIAATKGPFIIWCIMLGIYLALDTTHLPDNLVNGVGKALVIMGIFSVTLVISNIVTSVIKEYSNKLDSTLPVSTFTQNIARVIIFGIGLLIILNNLGIAITPILTTLGIGGLAVALALQDTFSNLFAGFYIIAARQIRIGDYIKLEGSEEGYILDINWRITKIRTAPNNVVLVPNSKLTQAIITNYYLPNKEIAVTINLGVHYNSDLNKVEEITYQVAKEVMKDISASITGFVPSIRYYSLGDFSIGLSVVLRAKEFSDQALIKHEFIKRVHTRYQKEGIVIPYPIQAINYSQEKTIEPR